MKKNNNEITKLLPIGEEGRFPFVFQLATPIPPSSNSKNKDKWMEQSKEIEIDFYQTNQFKPFPFYSHISKIILPIKDE